MICELDHRRLLSSCCFFVLFCVLCVRVKPAVDTHLTLLYIVFFSAIRTMFVKNLLAVCMLVNCAQSDFLEFVKVCQFCCSL